MAGPEAVVAAAGRRDQLRPLTSREAAELAEHRRLVAGRGAAHGVADPPRFRLRVVDDRVLDGFEHGLGGDATLCGLAPQEVFVMRHLFRPDGRFACPACAAAVRVDRE